MQNTRHTTSTGCRRRRGFTLIEAAMVTAIIGFGVVGMLQLLAAGTRTNSEGAALTVAVNLTNNIREISLGMAYRDPQLPNQWSAREGIGNPNVDAPLYDNITDLDTVTFSPPLDVRRSPIAAYGNWAQNVVVQTVSSTHLASLRPRDINEPTVRVTVTITRNGQFVHEASWLVVAPNTN